MSQNSQYADGYYGQGNGGGSMGEAGGGGGIRIMAIPGALLRQLVWAVPALLIMSILSFWFTKDIKRQYVADGRILVKLGSDIVYNPISGTGTGGNPMMITPDHVTLTEVGIIKNTDVMNQVIDQMIASPINGGIGIEAFAPSVFKKMEKEGIDSVEVRNELLKLVDKSYSVSPMPKSFIVGTSFKHPNPKVAVQTLEKLMLTYRTFRKDKFVTGKTGNLGERRADTEDQLRQIEARIQALLNKNGISNFTTEQTGVGTRAELLRTQLNTLRGRLAAAEASLAASEDSLRNLPETINLYIDDRARQRLAQANLERRQLLAKYLPTSNPVRAKEAEIREIQAQINSNGGKPAGGRRVGPNPVHQAALTQRNTYQATADSLREQEVTLQRQVNAAIAKVKRMRQLSPKYTNLIREKTTIETRLQGLQARETQALVDEKQLENNSENIKFITMPSTARKGRNMRKIMLALAIMGSAFSIFMLALLRVFLDPKLYGPGPHSRLAQTVAPAAAQEYYGNIPEAVPNYAPEAEPMPAYAPAAYGDAAYGDAYDQSSAGSYEQTEYSSPYGDPGPVEYVHPQSDQMYADGSYADNSYAGGSTTSANPYASTTAQPYPAPAAPQPEVQYTGPDGNIPVLG